MIITLIEIKILSTFTNKEYALSPAGGPDVRIKEKIVKGMDQFDLKKTTAGKDPVTTLPAAIANEFIRMRKNINTNFILTIVTLSLSKG